MTESHSGLDSTSGNPTLVRAIGRWGLTAAVVNSVVGAGVFGLPSTLAGLTGTMSPLAVLIAGAGILVIVLCFAEVGSRFDGPGGPYLYAREAFSPVIGFQIGWLHIWSRLFSAAAVLNVLTGYLSALIPWTGTSIGRASVMILTMTLVTGTNVIGVRQASWSVNALTIAKLLPLALVVALGMFQLDRTVIATQVVDQPRFAEGVLLLIFSYGGFDTAIIAGSEFRNPKRDIAFAMITAMLAVTVIYCLIQVAVVGVLPNAASSKAPVAETLARLIGPAGVTFGSIAVVISVYGWLTGFSLMTPRILYSMSLRHELPALFGAVHPAYRTPHVAIIFNSAVALSMGLASSFGQLATFSAITRLVIYISTCAALIALRKKLGTPLTFRSPGGPALTMVAIAFCVWLLSTRRLDQAWLLPVAVSTGLLVWFANRGRRAESFNLRR